MKHSLIAIVTLLVLFAQACIKPETFPNEPEITGVGFSQNVIQHAQDSFVVFINFRDGDGDLGYEVEEESVIDLFIRNTRTGFEDVYNIPFIPQQGEHESIEGTVKVLVLDERCIAEGFPTPVFPPTDTIHYEVRMVDRAGNESNRFMSPPLFVICPEN